MADESAPRQNRSDFNKKWAQHIEQAKKFEKKGKWEEAGNAYFEAAKVEDKELFRFKQSSVNLLASADCYHKALCEKAYDTYLMVIDRCLKNNEIKQAIYISVKCGYQYEKDWSDFGKSEEFYDKADELRVKYDLEHSCALTSEYMQGVIRDVSKELVKFKMNIVNIIDKNELIMCDAGVCRKCIHFWKIFDEYFHEIRKKQNRNNIEWLKEYHVKFKEILAQTIADVERLAEERKKRASDKDPSQQLEDA